MPPSARLDLALAKLGYCPSREKAKAAVAAGLVYVNGTQATKPSLTVTPTDAIEVRGEAIPYVGRGGLKLEKALAVWPIELKGLHCVDAGASTGGFTDCMLQAGAAHVHAIDVGHGQLAEKLVADPRVTNLEGCDIRSVGVGDIDGACDFLGTDVSFISLGKVLPALASLVRTGGHAVCLVKPQFEAGPEHVGKKGVVKDPAVHTSVLAAVCQQALGAGFGLIGLSFSPVRGPEGNIEYLMYLVKGEPSTVGDIVGAVTRTVREAHAELN